MCIFAWFDTFKYKNQKNFDQMKQMSIFANRFYSLNLTRMAELKELPTSLVEVKRKKIAPTLK